MTQHKPDHAEAAEQLVAIATRKTGRAAFDDAVSVLGAATELDPGNIRAWRLLAEIHHREERLDAAIGCYRRGLQIAPARVDLMAGLANAYADAGRFDDAVATLSVPAGSEPVSPEMLYAYALALSRAGKQEAALERLDRVIDLLPDEQVPRFTRSSILLALGRFAEAWPDYDARHAADPTFRAPDLPRWDGAPAPNKRLLVIPEGGFGDIVWAARFLPLIKPLFGEVFLALPRALQTLLATVDGVDGFCAPDATEDSDFYCPILSLPARMNVTDPSACPPARLNPVPPREARLQRLIDRAGDRLRVGIIWSGNESYSENRHRAAPLEAFLPLVERPDIQLFSLQKGPQQAVLREAGLGDLIIESDDSDFAETAALVQALDLVIMTDTAVAHIAGSLGAPVWTLLDTGPFWLFGRTGSTTPWYPSMRLFRQQRPGDWPGVVAEVGHALDETVASRR